MRRVVEPPEQLATGLVLLDATNAVTCMTPEAEAWLDDVSAGGTDQMTRDDLLRIVFDAANSARTSIDRTPPISRIRTTSGRWLMIQATRVDPSPKTDVVVSFQSASLATIVPAACAWWGLTVRESQVLQHVIAGRAAKQIARSLNLSIETVNTHLKAVYRKAETSGREELLAQLR
jgi:DNA-binding CsgD family transcriptional regulator